MDYRALCLFFSWLMDDVDWANFLNSGVTKVMLPFGLADEDTLGRFASIVRTWRNGSQVPVRIILRLANDELLTPPGLLQGQLRQKQEWADGQITAVILGSEPEPQHLRMEWGYDWGNVRERPDQPSIIEAHLAAMDNAVTALDGTSGVQLVSPGWWQRPFREFDPVQPGIATWRELTHAACYNELDGMGVHIYGDDWASIADVFRYAFQMRMWGMLCHKPMWIDEVGIGANNDKGNRPEVTQVYKMNAVVQMARMLLPLPPGQPAPDPEHPWDGKLAQAVGQRVHLYCPFVSNGLGNHYPAHYIMRDPECYVLLGDLMRRGGYV